MRRQTITQYNVTFPARPRGLRRFADLLSKERVCVGGLVATTIRGTMAVQFLAPKSLALRRRLERSGMGVREDQVFQVEVPRHHWELHRLAKTLADQGINVISLYGGVDGDRLRLVLAVDQAANAVALAAKLGYDSAYLTAVPGAEVRP